MKFIKTVSTRHIIWSREYEAGDSFKRTFRLYGNEKIPDPAYFDTIDAKCLRIIEVVSKRQFGLRVCLCVSVEMIKK